MAVSSKERESEMNNAFVQMARHGLDLAEKDWRIMAVAGGLVVLGTACGWLAKRWCDKGDEKAAEAGMKRMGFKEAETIEDGFGSTWSAWCPTCKRKSMCVVRPGKVQCNYCG